VYPDEHLELRQGARIILKSKELHPGSSRREGQSRRGNPIDPVVSDCPGSAQPASSAQP
jgi:hypothetical protein